ncbi:hypothetical protein H6F75_26085 [Nodosilinea sp. FACHB-131]|uniref:hypothetical protein n=1 Tax=Cyanophyceae TaxID=3028117 RepID=UPI001685380E|nr:hypothetical protein [Nodosilinea sp. FACHB-131]MBD1876959.1 hypothetical protein [Nodosilinea sp. FACHB-131]
MSVAAIVAKFSCVGFSGSRSPSTASLAALNWLCERVQPSAEVVVGCARGIDYAARQRFPAAQVFRAAAFGTGRGAFAARSVACVRAVVVAGGLWVTFPASTCPVGLQPSDRSSRCFCGTGSGTWASLAFAIGCGLPCLVFLPADTPAPSGWGLQPLGGGWFHHSPDIIQPSLFD